MPGYPGAPSVQTVTDKLATIAPELGNVAGIYVYLREHLSKTVYESATPTDSGGNWSIAAVPAGMYQYSYGIHPNTAYEFKGSYLVALNPASSLVLPNGAALPKAGQVLSDNFRRPDTPTGQLGSSPTMPPWRITGPSYQNVKITSNQVVVSGALGVYYAFQRFWTTPRKLTIQQLFVANGSNTPSGMTLVCSVDNGLVNNCVHIIFQNDRVIVQKRIANVSTTVNTTIYPGGTIAPDSTTARFASVTYNGSTVVIVGCDGIQFSVTDADFATLAGPYCTWEGGSLITNTVEGRWVGATAEFDAVRAYPQFYREVIRADGPLAYLPFDDIDSTNVANGYPLDNAGSGNFIGGTPNVSVVQGAPGLIYGDPSTAFTTDGATAGVGWSANYAALQLASGTFECWFSTTEVRTSNRLIMGAFNRISIILIGGVLKVYDPSVNPRDTGIFVADGKPHHVVMTFVSGMTNGTLLYLDGRLVLTTTGTHVNLSSGVGHGLTSGTWGCAATFQHSAWYTYLLSAAQVLRHWQIGAGITADTSQGQTLPWAYTIPAVLAGQTAAVASVTTVTSPNDGKTHKYRISGTVTITTLGSGNVNLEVTYTDSNGAARTCIIPLCAEAGTFAASATTADDYKGLVIITVNPNTAITILTAGTFTGCTYNTDGLIEQMT